MTKLDSEAQMIIMKLRAQGVPNSRIAIHAKAIGDLADRSALFDYLLHGLELELAAELSAGLAHDLIFLPEPCNSYLGVHFSGARPAARICTDTW